MSVVPFRKPGSYVDDYITDFILAHPRFSEGTVDAYQRAIRQFGDWLTQRPGSGGTFRPEEITRTALEIYYEGTRRAGVQHQPQEPAKVCGEQVF